jgi:hypothetical protein
MPDGRKTHPNTRNTHFKQQYPYPEPQHVVLIGMRPAGAQGRFRPDGPEQYRIVKVDVRERSFHAVRGDFGADE